MILPQVFIGHTIYCPITCYWASFNKQKSASIVWLPDCFHAMNTQRCHSLFWRVERSGNTVWLKNLFMKLDKEVNSSIFCVFIKGNPWREPPSEKVSKPKKVCKFNENVDKCEETLVDCLKNTQVFVSLVEERTG